MVVEQAVARSLLVASRGSFMSLVVVEWCSHQEVSSLIPGQKENVTLLHRGLHLTNTTAVASMISVEELPLVNAGIV